MTVDGGEQQHQQRYQCRGYPGAFRELGDDHNDGDSRSRYCSHDVDDTLPPPSGGPLTMVMDHHSGLRQSE